MRKKLDTRFPAARIKKIMQADEDVGKIALAVPVLVSKALELFLQDLCDRTYEVTLQRGAKTMSALHLKHCVQSYNVFDFLKDVVSRVPDYGHGHGHGHNHSDTGADDRVIPRRRKAANDDHHDSDDDSKRSKMHEISHTGSSGRGRGRGRGGGRGRGRGRGAQNVERERETHHQELETEPCTSALNSSKHNPDTDVAIDNGSEPKELPKDSNAIPDEGAQSVRNIDLNANLNENEDKNASTGTAVTDAPSMPDPPKPETKHEEIPGWSLSDVDKMVIDSMQLAHLGRQIEEDEEDYDEEG